VENQSRQAANPQNFYARVVAKFKSNATENAANLVVSTDALNAVSKDHKRRKCLGSVLVTYKVFPEDIVENFDDLKARIKAILPDFSAIEGYGEEPVAFGLVALLVQVKFPEDKTGIVDEFEEKLAKIPGVSQAQTFQVRRTSRD
jgi:translation elongation factor aEF-1 beta